MAKLLYIEASPRKERSASIKVAKAFLDAYRKTHPGDTVDTLDLWKTELPAFDGDVIDYLQRALTAMYDHLKKGIPLPPSQVVRTTPRGAGAPPITPANVPPILADPPASDLIVMDQQTLVIPD